MLGYIGRRLLLMIPTLFGITFMVFMLLAMAPGGIGASLRAAGGNVDADSKASLQLLYIEDRYGLDDHEVVQYFRWLGRISPIKFGERSMRNYAGDLEEPPRSVKDLPIGPEWFGDDLEISDALLEQAMAANPAVANDANETRISQVRMAEALAEERRAEGYSVGEAPEMIPEYKDANKAYLRARAQYLLATRALESAINEYVSEDSEKAIEEETLRLEADGVDRDVAARIAATSASSRFSDVIQDGNEVDYERLVTLVPDRVSMAGLRSSRPIRTPRRSRLAQPSHGFELHLIKPYPISGVGFGNLINPTGPISERVSPSDARS